MAEKKPRCSKCGRTLRDPVSIAAGMGPVCRGSDGGGGGKIPKGGQRKGGGSYGLGAQGRQQELFPVWLDNEKKRRAPKEKIKIDQIGGK